MRLQKFGFDDCGGGKAPERIISFNISPEPVEVPGDLYVAANIDVKENLTSPVKVMNRF